MRDLLLQADARHIPLKDGTVQCVVTSPPYWGLRDYGVAEQLGLEPTPELYVAHMVEVFRDVRRVLRDDGTLWLNLGDSYATGAGKVGERPGGGAQGDNWQGAMTSPNQMPIPGLKPKDLVGVPWRVALALQADGWYLRSDIIWAKPNPMPESVTDRPTKAHEYLFLLSKRERYYYDAEAIKEQGVEPDRQRNDRIGGANGHLVRHSPGAMIGASTSRNRRSVWSIATEPYPEAHFATFPTDLVKPCVLAGTSEKGACAECGAPWERQTKTDYENPGNRTTNGPRSTERRHETAGFAVRLEKRVETLGWRPTCAHDAPTVPCLVLDPFAGSGTTVHVAKELGRRSVGLELKREYIDLARRRTAQGVLI